MTDARLTASTKFRSTPEQKAYWEALAKAEGFPFGLWIRRALQEAASRQTKSPATGEAP